MKSPTLRPRFQNDEPPSHLDRAGQRRTPLIWPILVAALFAAVLLVHFVIGLPPGH